MLRLNNEQITPAAEARALRLTQTQQYRRRRNSASTPRATRQNNRQQQPQPQQLAERDNQVAVILEPRLLTITLPWSFFVSLLATLMLCLHYSYVGSTISPLATVRQFDFASAMAGVTPSSAPDNGDFAVLDSQGNRVVTIDPSSSVTIRPSSSGKMQSTVQQPRLKAPSTAAQPTSPPPERPNNGPVGPSSTTSMETEGDNTDLPPQSSASPMDNDVSMREQTNSSSTSFGRHRQLHIAVQ
eukprot:6479125-Amphidinium_carterae.1